MIVIDLFTKGRNYLTNKTMENIKQNLADQINRVNKIIKEYDNLPDRAGLFSCGMMRHSIDKAEIAIDSDDMGELITAYVELKGYQN